MLTDSDGCDFQDNDQAGCKSATAVMHLSGTNFIDDTILH